MVTNVVGLFAFNVMVVEVSSVLFSLVVEMKEKMLNEFNLP